MVKLNPVKWERDIERGFDLYSCDYIWHIRKLDKGVYQLERRDNGYKQVFTRLQDAKNFASLQAVHTTEYHYAKV